MSTESIYLISLSWLQHRGVPIMNKKTIMNVLIAILLCASGFASVVSAAGEEAPPEDMHMVTISVDHDEETNEMTVSVALTWDYPSIYRNTADSQNPDERDGTVDASEAEEYTSALAGMSLEELQVAHRSHVWDMNLEGQDDAASEETTFSKS